MRVAIILFVFITAKSLFCGEPQFKDFDLNTEVVIQGVASGGEVSLVMPYATVKATTAAGDSSATVVAKLFSELKKLSNANKHGRTESTLVVGDVLKGQVALASTDAGIIHFPSVESLSAQVVAAGKINISWNLPEGVVFDEIFIYCNGVIGAKKLVGNATTYLDDLGASKIRNLLTKGREKLEYRVIGLKNGIPSALSTVIINNPIFGN